MYAGAMNEPDAADRNVYVSSKASLEVPIVGMTTACRNATYAFAERLGVGDLGYAQVRIVVQRVLTDRGESLAATYEGSTLGYLAHGFPGSEHITLGGAIEAPMQVFTRQGRAWLKFQAWVWAGQGAPEWRFSEANRPPMNAQEEGAYGRAVALQRLERYANRGIDIFEAVRAGTAPDGAYVSLNRLAYDALRDGQEESALLLVQMSVEGLVRRNRPNEVMCTPTAAMAARVLKALGMRAQEMWVLEWWKRCTDPRDQLAYEALGRRLKWLQDHGVRAEPLPEVAAAWPGLEESL